jgi:guanine deaminase
MCFGAILWANIESVYYGCNIIDTEAIGFRDKQFYETNKDTFMKELDRKEVLKLYDEYLAINQKTNY